jgi:transcriptional regulator with XRE-family HTH domain
VTSGPAKRQDEPTSTIARRVRELRKRLGLTAEDLSERMRETGVPFDKTVLANLETGRRRYITVQELLALALVLDVSPVDLLVPSDTASYPNVPPEDEVPYAVTPAVEAPRYMVRNFMAGEYPLYGMDAWTFYRERPPGRRPSDESLARTVRIHQLGRPIGPEDRLPEDSDGER